MRSLPTRLMVRSATPVELALSRCEPYISNDLLADPRIQLIHGELQKHQFFSGACFPLVVENETVGSFTMYAAEKNFFDAELQGLVTEMVTDVCFALSNFERETQRRQAEERLRLSEEAIRLNGRAVEACANGIVLLAPQDQGWGIIHANPAFQRITGLRRADWIGRTLGEMRKGYHKQLSAVLIGELDKDLTGHSVQDIEKALEAA